jgi:hypothetical protein
MALELNPEVERQVLECAQAAGTPVSDYVAGLLQAAASTTSLYPAARIRGLLHQWQQFDHTPVAAPAPNAGTLTPSEALFRQWEQEDAKLTDEERQAEDIRWQQFQQDIDAQRLASGMQPIF